MNRSKWSRLGLGVCLLGMLFVFQGTAFHDSMACFFCEAEAAMSGYLEIQNNTPYNIMVFLHGPNKAGPYVIKTTPSFLRKMVENGRYKVTVSVYPLIGNTPVFYKVYQVDVPGDMATAKLTVTTPVGYIPIPK